MSKVLEINIDSIDEISDKIESELRDFVGEYADIEPTEIGFKITAEDFFSNVEIDIPVDNDNALLIDLVRNNIYDRNNPEEVYSEVFDTINAAVDFIKTKSETKALMVEDDFEYDY